MDTQQVTLDELVELVTRAFEAAKTSRENARAVAAALVAAEVDGQKGHGLSRIESYTAQSNAGKVNGFAKPTLAFRRPGAILVDAANGFAYPAIDVAAAALPEAAAANGIAAAAITRSHHCGAVGLHVERLAEAGLISLFFANTPKAIAPWGGRKPLFGTNPIAFAAPRRDAPPIIVDLALSEVARGKILQAANKSEPIPEGWAVDENGRPTNDARAALSGTLMPVGGAKGAALALMVELLAAAVGGANLAIDASSFFDDAGGPPGVGQFVIAIDPDAFAGRDLVLDRIETLAAAFAGNGDARLPGSRRGERRAAAQANGLEVESAVLDDLSARAARASSA